MAILKHIASKSSNYGAALEYLIFKHDELRKTPILDQNGNRIMRDEFYLDGLNCEPYSFDAIWFRLFPMAANSRVMASISSGWT